MAEIIRFPIERRQAAPEVEYVREPGWFGVRLRPPEVVTPPGVSMKITHWLGEPVGDHAA